MNIYNLAHALVGGEPAWIAWRQLVDGSVEIYRAAMRDKAGGEALLTVIEAGGPIADAAEFRQRLEDACPDDDCLGHVVTRLSDEEVEMLRLAIEGRLDRRDRHDPAGLSVKSRHAFLALVAYVHGQD